MRTRAIWMLGLLLLVLTVAGHGHAVAQNRVENILSEVDQWIDSDTTRIFSYIDSANVATSKRLESSKHWKPTYDDLSFLLGIDYVGSPEVDNTGRHYFLMRITGEISALFYMDQPMGFPHQLTPNNWIDQDISIGDFLVHPSGKYVLVATMLHGDENFDIYRFDRDGSSKPLLIAPKIQYRQLIFEDEDKFFLISNDRTTQTIIRYTMSTGKVDTLYTEPGWFGPVDYKDGMLLCNRWLSFSESQLFILDTKTLKTKNITEKGLYYGGAFTLDAKVVTLTSALSGPEEFTKFAVIDPKKPKKLQLLYDPGMEVDGYLVVPRAEAVLASLNKDGYSELAAFDLKGKSIEVAQPEIGVVGGISSNDYGDISFGFSSPRVAPTFYSFRLGATNLKQMAAVSTFGFDFSNVNVELIHYPSKDGTMIPALLYAPKSAKKDGRNPAVVNYHGGPPSQSRPYFQRNIAFALSRGLVMLFPNVRGSTGYGPAYEEADNLEGRFTALEDAIAAVDYLVNEGWSNTSRIAIWGASYGGYTVNYLGTKWPEKFACIVSEVGVADVDYELTHGDITFKSGWEKEYGPVGSELSRELSPIFYAEKIARPIFVTAGYHDPRVFSGGPRRFGYVLRELGKDVLYYEDVQSGHGASMKKRLIEDYTRSYVFILDHIVK